MSSEFDTDDDPAWRQFEPLFGDFLKARGFRVVRRWCIPVEPPAVPLNSGTVLVNDDLRIELSQQWGCPQIKLNPIDSIDGIELGHLLDEIDEREFTEPAAPLPLLARRLASEYDTIVEMLGAANRERTYASADSRIKRSFIKEAAEVTEEEDRRQGSIWHRLKRLLTNSKP